MLASSSALESVLSNLEERTQTVSLSSIVSARSQRCAVWSVRKMLIEEGKPEPVFSKEIVVKVVSANVFPSPLDTDIFLINGLFVPPVQSRLNSVSQTLLPLAER